MQVPKLITSSLLNCGTFIQIVEHIVFLIVRGIWCWCCSIYALGRAEQITALNGR